MVPDVKRKSLFYRPLQLVNSYSDCGLTDAGLFSPLGQIKSFTLKGYQTVSSLIVHLLLHSSPSAIFFAVMPVIINPINARVLFSKLFDMLKVRFVHIVSELFKGVPKTLDSATAVYVPPISAGFGTPNLDISKGLPESSLGQPVGREPFSHTIVQLFQMASATCSMTLSNMVSISNRLFAALTQKKPFIAKPTIVSDNPRFHSYCCKFPKLFSGYVFSSAEYVTLPTLVPRNRTLWDSVCQVTQTIFVHA